MGRSEWMSVSGGYGARNVFQERCSPSLRALEINYIGWEMCAFKTSESFLCRVRELVCVIIGPLLPNVILCFPFFAFVMKAFEGRKNSLLPAYGAAMLNFIYCASSNPCPLQSKQEEQTSDKCVQEQFSLRLCTAIKINHLS